MENENMTTITRKFRVSADQMAQAARECVGAQIPVPDERMEAIFNVSSADSVAAFNGAKDAGFPWQFFTDRIQQKARLQGMLPQQGMLIILPRYVDTASFVLDALLSSAEAVGDPSQRSRMMEPWKVDDVQQWRQMLCSFSVSMFDAGVVAALTLGANPKFDPVNEGAGYAIFGDVGIMGLRKKAVSFVESIAGAPAVNAMAKVGNEACVYLKWDSFYSGMAFKSPSRDAVCDILVEGNTFVNPRGLLMYLENVSRVTFRDNVVEFKGDRWDPLPCAGKIRILGGNDIDVPEHLIEKRESKKKN